MMRLVAGALALTTAVLLSVGGGKAASLEVGPIRVQMINPERTTTIKLRNSGTAPITVQIRAVDWNQANGSDAYVPSVTLVASPPLAEIAPGESQVVRLVVDYVDDIGGEHAYRLILDELPVERPEGGAGVQAALRALVPVFITPSLQSRPRLTWTAARTAEGLRLTIRNEGDTRELLINSRVMAGGTELAGGPRGYVLAGGTRNWTLPAPPAGATSLRITSEGEFGAVEVDVPITS